MEERTRRLDWVLIVGLALILRLAFNWSFVTDTNHADIASMYQYSLRVAQGIYYGEGVYWPPGFIFLSGALIRLFGAQRYWTVIRGVHSLLGAVTCGFGYDIGCYAFGRRAAGIISGVLLAAYLPLIYYTGLAFSETLFIFFFLWSVIWLYRLAEARDNKAAIWAGFMLGLATLTRPVTLLVPVLLLPWYWFIWERQGRLVLARAGVVMVVLLLVLVPWTIRNFIVTGDLVLVDMNGGVNFYIGHNEKATGTWMD
ncbi:MAG: ArnT family glycosyltransferase, partial [bacterium]